MTAIKRRDSSDEKSAGMSRRSLLQHAVALGIPAFATGLLNHDTAHAAVPAPPEAAETPDAPSSHFFNRNTPHTALLLLNQVGYCPGDHKQAVVTIAVPPEATTFVILEDAVAPLIRFRGTLTPLKSQVALTETSSFSYTADFSDLTDAGRYRIRLADGQLSEPFSIGTDIYRQVIPMVLSYFDAQTCGMHSEAHDACHEDDGQILGGPRDGQHLDAAGGWHDAGDYLKFVETTSFVTAVMATTLDRFLPVPRRNREMQVVQQGILTQLRIGLDWLLKMHPSPDEFYYQVGDESDHNTWRLPEADGTAKTTDRKLRPVYAGVGANLAGRTAVSFAIAARLYRNTDRDFAARCRTAAESVYALGLKNKVALTTQPADFYPEHSWEDDMEWAAVELYRTTKKPKYLEQALTLSKTVGAAGEPPSVYSVHALAHHALYEFASESDKARLLTYLKSDFESIQSRAQNNVYGFGTSLGWGTTETVAGAGILCHLYGRLTGDVSAITLARQQRDFILGCNPWAISFVIGAGSRYPLNPHHQIANIKGIELIGALVGGPSTRQSLEHEFHQDTNASGPLLLTPPLVPDDPNQIPVYEDIVENYVTNEPANDYTVKFLLLAALDT
jgi:hypothetical protein